MSAVGSLEVTWVQDSQEEVEFRPEEPSDGFHVINPSLPVPTEEFSWTPCIMMPVVVSPEKFTWTRSTMAPVVEPPKEPERTLWSGT